MSHERAHLERYESPRIEERTAIDVPLIGAQSGLPGTPSAVFRSVPPGPYVAPRIVSRDPLDVPLIGPVGSLTDNDSSAVFRTDQIAEE